MTEEAVPEVKELWQMTQEEYHQYLRRKFYDEARLGKPAKYEDFDLTIHQLYAMKKNHERIISDALSEGKPVPAEVLAGYPDLKPPAVEAIFLPMGAVEYDRRYTLVELREMAKKKGLSPSGSKKEIARRLIKAG